MGSQWSLEESSYFVMMLMPVVIITGYFFNYYLVPKYLFREKHLKFFIYTVYMILVSLHLELVVVILSFIILANYRYNDLHPNTSNVFALSSIMYGVVLIISFIRLVRNHFQQQEKLKSLELINHNNKKKHLIVKENRKSVTLNLENIHYIESLSDYVKIHLIDREVITKEKIGKMNANLSNDFVRIHRSYIINKKSIVRYTRDAVELKKIELPVSRTYKKQFISSMES